MFLQDGEVGIHFETHDLPRLPVEETDGVATGFDPRGVDETESLEAEADLVHHLFKLIGDFPDHERRRAGPEPSVPQLELLARARHEDSFTSYAFFLIGGFGHSPSRPP